MFISGDTIGVTELSRMTRSLLHLLETVRVLERREVNLLALRENIDATSATGGCLLSMMRAGRCSRRRPRSRLS